MNVSEMTYDELEEVVQLHLAFGAFYSDCSERAAKLTTITEIEEIQALMHERVKPALDELGRRRDNAESMISEATP